MITDRKSARQILKTLLAANLTNAVAGYDYAPHDFAGVSPVFYISSSGSEPVPFTGKGVKNKFHLNVHLLALYSSNDAYTEAEAENALDDLENQLRQTIAANRKTADWQDIRYAGKTNADQPILIGGELYLHEIVPIVMETY